MDGINKASVPSRYLPLLNALHDIRIKEKERTAKYIELNILEADINALKDKVDEINHQLNAAEFHHDITAGG